MQVGHQHCSSFEINHTITACLYLFQRRRVQLDRLLRRARLGLARRCLGRRAALDLADERDAAVFGVDGSVVAEEQVSSDEGASTFSAFEGTLFGVCGSAPIISFWSSQEDRGPCGFLFFPSRAPP